MTDDPQHQVKSVTAKKYWTSVQGFFEWAVEERLIASNPASGIKLTRKRGETRASPKPFDRAEIERFFSTPLYQGHAGPKRLLDPGTDVSRGGKWWAGVLPFFTALRAGELAQLLPEDFDFDAEVPHLKVREEDDAGNKVKSAKTRSSIRDVPMSPILLKLGLREFVEGRRRAAPSQRVFAEFRLGTGGRKSEGMTRFWGDYLKANQIWKPGRATHVWRHTVASFLRASGVSDEEIGAVFGHAGRTVAAAKLVARKIGPSDEVKTQVNAAWLELSRITQPCDAAAGVFSKALEGGSAGSVTAYRVASQAKSICANAGLNVLGVSVPKGLSDPHRKAFRDALAGCSAAYAGRSVMYGEMMKVLDGDRRPSQLAKVQTAADTSQNEVVQCGLNVISVADSAGIKLASPDVAKAD